MAGYSGTPLIKKLGIKEGFRVSFVDAPEGFRRELGTIPAGVAIMASSKKPLDLILAFVKSEARLTKIFGGLARRLSPAGMLWIAWPKKSGGIRTDLSFAAVQQTGLAAGLVDTKICAVNEVWSGLRFVIRVKDRQRF